MKPLRGFVIAIALCLSGCLGAASGGSTYRGAIPTPSGQATIRADISGNASEMEFAVKTDTEGNVREVSLRKKDIAPGAGMTEVYQGLNETAAKLLERIPVTP
ncbi:MAG: hypothetical protein GX751_07430 [Desulfuromonadaceae bacterium]|nr:hypothetical protein [Desulfuromonadaceae bacterium]